MTVTKLILALCLSTKVAGFASYSGKTCIVEESCPPAGSVDGFACAAFENCQDPNVCPMESDTPAENCIFNPTCFCLMDSLAGLQGGGGGGGGGSGPACTPNY